jgi:hypothetical protein
MVTLEDWKSRSYREDSLAALLRKSNAIEMADIRRECARLGQPMPTRFPAHWAGVGPGTNFNGLETLASMTVDGVASTPATTPGSSILTRECLEPIAPSYFKFAGSRFLMRAYGTVLATATIPTFQLALQCGPTYANPLTSGQMLAQFPAVITPAAAVTHQFFLECLITVRATGSSGSLRAVGKVLNDILTAGTQVWTLFQNTAVDTAPTAVVLTNAGGLLVPIYFDLSAILGAATAGNSFTCLDYELASLN